MSFYPSHTVLNKTFPRLCSKKHLWLPEWTGTGQIIGGKGGKGGEGQRVRESKRKPRSHSWEKPATKELKPPEIPAHRHPAHFRLITPLKMRKLEKEDGGGQAHQKNKKDKKRGEKRGEGTYLRSLVCSFGQKWWEEKAWRSREVWGRKRWRRRNSSRSKLYKTSPRVSGGRTVIPAEQVRTDLFSATPGNTNLGTDWRVTPLLMTFFSFSFL